MKYIKGVLLFCSLCVVSSCTQKKEISLIVVNGLTALYKGQFMKASTYITPDSYHVLSFIQAVSSKKKLALMNIADVKVSVLSTYVFPGDSVANVEVGIENYVSESASLPVFINIEKREVVDLKKVGGKWLINIKSK